MQKLFNKILVPVDFSAKSKKAVEKAVGIAVDYECSVTLLHVVTTSPLAAVAVAEGHMAIPYNIIANKTELEFQLEKLAASAKLLSENKIKTEHCIVRGTWDEVIIDMVNEHHFDLVLIDQK
jgi:nucleotide-binding universal stress UspA family protein